MEFKRDKNIAQDSEYSNDQYNRYSREQRTTSRRGDFAYPSNPYQQESRRTPLQKEKSGKELSIFDACLGAPTEKQRTRAALNERGREYITAARDTIPGFFTPMKRKKEFAVLAAAPIVCPVILAIVSAASAIVAAGAALTALGSLVFAAGAGLHSLRKPEAKETTREALMVAKKAGIVAAACAAATIAAALLAVVLAPVALAYFVTRSGATLANAASKCISSCSSKENAEKRELDSTTPVVSMQ
ncbi:hypothetical protein DGG96_19645 [Legionella qingyii]|uniref:Uncharacterized protein n=1 Tax=Legionella qingyii TaxID=2184757 RepID=A0A317TX09_9GAMM|nr:hypothetical protein [Legionella qingyii]PWY53934.1 hypothetical protein DGG96_19645 [Legionella qingyii]RUR18639.1 hypothetical protein ELY20_16410 [Legionella qingyii]RUR26870.1 hypothetical protein ELY16_06435 [Legionella qingyii]